MAQFDLNLSTRPFPAYRLINVALVTGLIALIVVSAWQAYGFVHFSGMAAAIRPAEQEARVEADALGARVGELGSRLDRPEATAKLNEIGFLNQLIARKNLSLQLDIARVAVLQLNYPALRLVVGNLLRNAVRYTESGFIRVGYASKRLAVADSGRGIGAEHIGRVFERFFRAEGRAEGNGLGLAIVKRICDQYGWKIEVDSAPGGGSTFSITFP